jgi:hypothetical protein
MKKIWTLLNLKSHINKQVIQKTERILRENKFVPISETEDWDIFIAGFPKSGNTWMQNLISGILYGMDSMFLPDSLTQEIVPDVHYKKFYKRFLDFNCFKTHHLPKPKYRRVIFLIRDPKDVLVSYYHFKKNFYGNADLDKMIYDKKGEFQEWKTHTNQWMKNPFNSEILTIRYEDLIRYPLDQLKSILTFLKINRSDEVLLRVIEGNSINNMKIKEDNWGFDNDVTKQKQSGRFFRKGQIGSYEQEISESQISFINEKAAEELTFFNYD